MLAGGEFWFVALLGITIYCGVQAVRDFRAKRYVWAAAAGISAALLATMPVQTHAIKVVLPHAR